MENFLDKGVTAMHLEEMKKEIEKLVLEKGFYNKPEDIPKKLLFALARAFQDRRFP
jgi:hypothetical protein